MDDLSRAAAVVGVNQIEREAVRAKLALSRLQILTRLVDVKAHDVGETLLVFGEEFAGFGIGRKVDGDGGISSLRAVHDEIVDERFAVNGVGNCKAQVDVGKCARVMIFRVLIKGQIVKVARRKRLEIFGKLGVLLDMRDLVAADIDDVQRAVLKGGQRVIGRRNNLILEGVNGNLRGIPIAVVFLKLNVGGTGDIARQHKCAVRQESFGAGAVAARLDAVVKFLVDGVKSRERHKRQEERNRRIQFHNKSFSVGRTHSQSFRVAAFYHCVSIFHASNGIAHDI